MDVVNYLQTYGRKIDLYLTELFKEKIKEAKKIDPFLVNSLKNLENYLYGGKKIRGVLTTLGYQVAGGKDVKEIIPAAAAVELVHSGLLIHDDFIDNDEVRRGKPTIHKIYEKGMNSHYGASMATVLGDIALFLSNEIISSLPFKKENIVEAQHEFNHLLVNTGYGEMLDVAFDLKENVTWKDIEKIRIYKTAHYTFVMPLTVGAILGGASKKQIEAIKDYGEPVGLAFQLKDDVLGVFGKIELTGKSNDSDIKEGKKTFLFTKAVELANRKDNEFLDEYYGDKKAGDDQTEIIRNIIKNTGSLGYSLKTAQKKVRDGKKFIPEMTKDIKLQNVLSSLADFVVQREK